MLTTNPFDVSDEDGDKLREECGVFGIWGADVAASFVALIGRGLGADAVQRGRSPFAGLLGSEVAAEALVIHDDGLDPAGSASSPFDGEGVPRRRTALIEGGRLKAYLYDTYTAHRDTSEAPNENMEQPGNNKCTVAHRPGKNDEIIPDINEH